MPFELVAQSVGALLVAVLNLLVAGYAFALGAKDPRRLPFALGPLGVSIFGFCWFIALLDPSSFERMQDLGALAVAAALAGFCADFPRRKPGVAWKLGSVLAALVVSGAASKLFEARGFSFTPVFLRLSGLTLLGLAFLLQLRGDAGTARFRRRIAIAAFASGAIYLAAVGLLHSAGEEPIDPVVVGLIAAELFTALYVFERKVELHFLVSRAITYSVLSMLVALAASLVFRRLGYPVDLVQVTVTVGISLVAAVLFVGLGELVNRKVEAVLFPDQAKVAALLAASKSELAALRARLEQVERLAIAGELAASVAHEIKNPLAALNGYAQLLGSQLTRVEPAARANFEQAVKVIGEECGRINERVSELLDLGRKAPLRVEPLDLNRLALDVIAVVDATLGGRVVKTRFDAGAGQVFADADALRGALLNLMKNAIEASPPGGEIEVVTRVEGGSTRLEVLDRGPGLPKTSDPERVFQAFYTTKTGGTGLGLAIARSAVEACGGRLMLASRGDGAGACAQVELRRVGREASAAAVVPREALP
ncbi:MAG: ATP-binding protein [Myxococcaceae bacterium]